MVVAAVELAPGVWAATGVGTPEYGEGGMMSFGGVLGSIVSYVHSQGIEDGRGRRDARMRRIGLL